MSNWNPKPVRPQDPNPLFPMDDEVHVAEVHRTPIQQQRDEDGSPYTRSGASILRPPGAELTLDDFNQVNKSVEPAPTEPALDPDEVIKAYMDQDTSNE